MAIDLGSSNTTRYHTVADHADFTLPDDDWTLLALVERNGASSVTNYIFSTGDFGAANSINLYIYGDGVSGTGVKVSSFVETWLPFASDSLTLGKWYWIYAVRRGGLLRAGQIAVGGSSTSESSGVAISGSQNSGTGPYLGFRAAGLLRPWNGRWSQIAFISGKAITTDQATGLARGIPLRSMGFAPNIKALWHGRGAGNATFKDIIGGHVATRQGTSYGTNEADTLTPYVWLPTYIRGASSSVKNLVVANAVQENTAGTGAVSQAHTLLVDPATQANLASEPEIILGATIMLAAANVEQGNVAASVGVTQAHSLVHAPSIQDNIAADSTAVQEHILTAANATQQNAASNPAVAVISTNDLAVNPITQGNTAATGRVARTQTLTASSATQVNRASTGALSAGIIFEDALANVTGEAGIKKPGIPHDAPAWLRTTLETVIGRRGNRIAIPEEQDLTFSSTPTQAEMEAFYNYTNTIRNAVEQLIERLDS